MSDTYTTSNTGSFPLGDAEMNMYQVDVIQSYEPRVYTFLVENLRRVIGQGMKAM